MVLCFVRSAKFTTSKKVDPASTGDVFWFIVHPSVHPVEFDTIYIFSVYSVPTIIGKAAVVSFLTAAGDLIHPFHGPEHVGGGMWNPLEVLLDDYKP